MAGKQKDALTMTEPHFCNHAIVDKNPADYTEIVACPRDILAVWKLSLFAHELLHGDGRIKDESELAGDTLQKYIAARESIKRGEDIPKPILGVGIYEGIEIGVGREIIAAAYHENLDKIPASVRKAQADEIKKHLK